MGVGVGCSCCWLGGGETLLAFASCAISWPLAVRLLFRRGGLFAAVSISSAEAEELEPTGVLEDETDCMGLIFWLSGVLV